MTRLPHSDKLILDLRKLEDYCLNRRIRAVGTRLGSFVTRLASLERMLGGCAMPCWTPCVVPTQSGWNPIRQASVGGLTLPLRDTSGAPW